MYSSSLNPFPLCPYCSSDVTCAEHQVKLGGVFYSLLYHMCDGWVVTKTRKISNKLLQISREWLMEPSEQQKVQAIGFMVKERINKAQWLLVSNCTQVFGYTFWNNLSDGSDCIQLFTQILQLFHSIFSLGGVYVNKISTSNFHRIFCFHLYHFSH